MKTQTIADFPYTDSPPRVRCPQCAARPDTFCVSKSGRRLATLFHDARYLAATRADRTPAALRPLRVDDARTLARVRSEIVDAVTSVLRRECGDVRARDLDLVAVLGRTDATLEDFARVADQVLAWDSQSFVNLCGVRSRDVRASDLTTGDYMTLQRLNAGRPFAYDLHTWST